MKKLIYFLITTFLMGGSCFAQNEWANWIFGQKAYVQFAPNSTAFPVSPNSVTMPNWAEGVSSVSDAGGNLLFYTNGVTVWTNPTAGTVMTGGNGLFGNASSTEGALIVPDPGNSSRYYIFTTEIGANARLSYSIVSLSPTVEVLLPSKNTVMRSKVAEKVAVIKACGENAYWIVAHDLGNNQYVVWRLSASGLNGPVIYAVGAVTSATGNAGHLKFSPDGTLMAAAHVDLKKMELFNFNTSTGVISNIGSGISTTYGVGAGDLPYGVEFSPDSKKLYVTITGTFGIGQSRIYQYDVTTPINAIATQFTVHQYSPASPNYGYCSLQLGPDDRIYVVRRYIDSIYYIPDPNLIGAFCNFNPTITRIKLASTPSASSAQMGLPNFPSRFSNCLTANAGIDDTICSGYATQLAGSATTGASYSWAPATGLSCTNCPNPIAAPLTSTTYTLTATLAGNTATDEVTVIVNQNCCDAANNDLFTMHTSSFTISSNTYFTGKHYVGPGVIITVNGASLDLTSVDMVFSPCAGIEFRNGASLIANNSVFRPCDINLWWAGFSFFDGSVGTVNSCTFENAGKALEFNGSSGLAAYSNITNNLFLNCRKGVNIVGGNNFLESITNNVFTVDFNNIDYSIPTCSSVITTPYEYHAIEVTASDLGTAYISQNQFINNQVGKGATALVSGIYYLSVTGGAISQNTFTNLYRDIDASECANLSIENNEMERLQFGSSLSNDYQIRLIGCSYIWVTGNHLVNSVEVTDFSAPFPGSIYTENDFALNIKDNTINGSRGYGITSVNDYGCSFTGNVMNGINQVGILLSNLQQSEVNCNEIHIQRNADFPGDGTGIYYVGSLSMNNTIQSNCIFDAVYPIGLSPGGINVPGPVITNNYLFNYTGAGILNFGYLFNLGSGISSYAVSGHNTFHSNTAISGVSDIYSSSPLIAYGNYGISTISGSVSTVGNNIYSSTASCGQQIGPYANNQADENICNLFFLNLDSMAMKSASGEMMLSPAFEQKVKTDEVEFSLSKFTSLLQLLQSSNPAEANKLFDLVQKNGWLSANDFGIFKFYHSFFAYDYATASTELINLNGSVDADWHTVKSILVNHIKNDGSLNQISDEEVKILKTIEQSSSPFAADARELLQATVGGYDYHFKSFPGLKGIEEGTGVAVSQAQLHIYPNPAHMEAAIEYVLPDGLSEAMLKLYDLSGRLMETQKLKATNSTVQINLEGLSNGSYIVALENAGRILLRGKLIKE